VVGGDAIRGFWEGALNSGLSGGTLETVAFEEHGDVAIEWGVYTMEMGGQSDAGKYVVVHRRQPDGSWKMGIDIWNSSRPEPGAAAS
jgi:ketosteroid isomerase-like protein